MNAKHLWFVDNLRVLLTVLVVLHHIAVTYSGMGLWYYNEQPDSGEVGLVLTVFLMLNQAWFMGAFFLLSGYFTPASYDRKGPRLFLRDRLVRLGIPFLVFYFVLNPLLYAGSHASYLDTIGSGPLWFVFALLVFDVSYVVFRAATAGRRLSGPKPLTFRKVVSFVVGLALVTYAVRIVVPIGTFVPVIDFPSGHYLPQYVSFFVLGVVGYRRGWMSTEGLGKAGLWLAVGATVVFLPLALGVGSDWAGHGTVASLFFALWDSAFAVGVVLALLTLFRRRFNTQGKVRRYLTRHAFTVYVIHAFVVTAAGHALSALDVPTLAKCALAAVVVLPACFLLAAPIRRLPAARHVL